MSSRDIANLRQGLVAAWIPSLGSTGYRLVDRVGSNHGVLTNMDAGSDWVVSGGNLSLDFDGTNDFVTTTLNNIAGVINTNVFTVQVWGYVRSFTNSPVIMSAGANTSPGTDSLLIETNNTGSQLYIKSANATQALNGARTYTLSTALQTNQWCNIVFTKTATGDNGSLFVNGVLQTSFTGTLNTAVITASDSLILAAYTNFLVSLNGQLDDIRIYSRALSATEISLLSKERGIGLQPRPKQFTYYQFPSGSKRRRILTGMP